MTDDLIERAKALCSGAALDINHTRFQLERFVVGSQPTAWGRYRTACVELSSRLGNAQGLEAKRDQLLSETGQHPDAVAHALADTERGLKAIRYEIEVLIELAERYRAQIPPDETWEDHQPEYYLAKLVTEAYFTYISTGMVPTDIIRHAAMLPAAYRGAFTQQLSNIKQGETPACLVHLLHDATAAQTPR